MKKLLLLLFEVVVGLGGGLGAILPSLDSRLGENRDPEASDAGGW